MYKIDPDFLEYLSKTVAPITSGFLIPFGFKPMLKTFSNPERKPHIIVALGTEYDFSIKVTSDKKMYRKVMPNQLISYIVELDPTRKKLVSHLWNTLTGCLISKRKKRVTGPYVIDGITYESVNHYSRAKGITETKAREKIKQTTHSSGTVRINKKVRVPFYIGETKYKNVKSAANLHGVTVEMFRKYLHSGKITIHYKN